MCANPALALDTTKRDLAPERFPRSRHLARQHHLPRLSLSLNQTSWPQSSSRHPFIELPVTRPLSGPSVYAAASWSCASRKRDQASFAGPEQASTAEKNRSLPALYRRSSEYELRLRMAPAVVNARDLASTPSKARLMVVAQLCVWSSGRLGGGRGCVGGTRRGAAGGQRVRARRRSGARDDGDPSAKGATG